jgi:hypothetical protein
MGVVKGLLGSKKFWVFVIGVFVVILNRVLDLGLTGDDLLLIGAGDVAALIGIGLADLGKEKAKTLAAAATANPPSDP